MSTIDDINNTLAAAYKQSTPGTEQETVNDGSAVVDPPKPNSNVGAPPVQLSFQDMYKKLNTYTPPTAEELEQERRKQKRDMVLASIGNGLTAFNQAYANTRGIKPMTDGISMTDKVRHRYERIQKERDALNREYAAGMMRAAQMDQQQGNWREQLEYQKGRDAKADERDQRNFDYTKQKDERDFNYKEGRDKVNDDFREKQFNEGKRQFNANLGLGYARINHDNNKHVTFTLGSGNGNIDVPTQALNSTNIAYVFNTLPPEVRSQVGKQMLDKLDGRPMKDENGNVVRSAPTTDEMLSAIGTYVGSNVATQNALREIAGQKPKNKGKGYGNEKGRGY